MKSELGRVYEIVGFRQLLSVNSPVQYVELLITDISILPDRA